MDPPSPDSHPAWHQSPVAQGQSSQIHHFSSHSPLLRSVSEGESTLMADSPPQQHILARPPKFSLPLPDPSHFPEPYLFRPRLTSTTPALSSAGSSSESTRSSAYTSSGSAIASGDYNHVHVVSGEDDTTPGVGITSDAVKQFLAKDSNAPVPRGPSQMPFDQSRWSDAYSASVRSRSSSTGGNSNENAPPVPPLRQQASYDLSWQAVDEKDEMGASEDDTDFEQGLDDDDMDDPDLERTSAAVIAEEGRGLIVQGEGVQLSDLHIQPGTTHLIVGSSNTPNIMPAFLSNTVPQICNTLLALDISANFLGALPPCLAMCSQLEELNIASNPLRVLPAFLCELHNLQVLISDCTGIATLPDCLAELERLHTISIRRNKLHSLPSWLCLLPALQTLCVDGNPFQGPWKALVEPLLAKVPMTPMYPPSTPSYPLLSASIRTSQASTDIENTDTDESSDPPSPDINGPQSDSPDEESTITPDRAPFLNRIPQPQELPPPPPSLPRSLQRTRTTPNRAFHQNRLKAQLASTPEAQNAIAGPSNAGETRKLPGDRELRKMKSAGDIRRAKALGPSTPDLTVTTPPRPSLAQIGTSQSSSTLLRTSPPASERPAMSKRFASLGPSSSMGTPSRPGTGSRTALTRSLWDGPSEQEMETQHNRNTVAGDNGAPPMRMFIPQSPPSNVSPHEQSAARPRTSGASDGGKEMKERGSRWGFLKKMSMGKMKSDVPSRPGTSQGRPPMSRPYTSTGSSRMSTSPRIDVRLSTNGTLDAFGPSTTPASSPHLPSMQPSSDSLQAPSPNLLVPSSPSPMSRASKRRSFLPLDGPTPLQIPIPDSSPFVQGVTANNDDEEDHRNTTPSPVDLETQLRREEVRAKDAYMRALRSVMAYLRDMNDLGLSQAQPNPMSMYGAPSEEALSTARSRRPTVSEGSRDVSMIAGSSDYPNHLRSAEAMAGLRSGTASQTMSVATDSSAGSSDERKFKDDKGKRAMIIREIVATERTYVKGLEELVEIYIKPASVQANLLTGVGSSKDTIVPLAERKIVFNGIDALYSFHKDSFLPALEMAADPLMRPAAELQAADADGQLSQSVAKAVGNMFIKHAAFMRMYSSYINNFDNSVQRVKHWSSDRSPAGPTGSALSPSSSAVQLAGLGLAMAVTNPGALPDAGSSLAVPNLSTSQRKRIRSYLKRCRVHPRHSQLNLEGYLLLPVQRVPRYRLLLGELLRSTPPSLDFIEDPLDRAFAEISSLANNMNEGKREAESRRKLVQWQSRIRGKFPSPLVQPHRRLIMDGRLLLTRVVRKTAVDFEAINAHGDATSVKVDCLAPELTPRPLVGILCNDLLVLCRDPTDGNDPVSVVDLWAVLRMQTLPQPASIVHGNVLRLVDNKAILYFDAPSPSDALNWYRAINLHIPASKT
ncbi:hypothetical protein PTI98_001520 [Pleurotus ostreatus]|nr:hypothetical protein PTI98_001520 [Pleurotus ostreatus]